MLGKEKFSPQGFVFTVKGFWVKSGSGVTAVLLKYHAGLLELEGQWGNGPIYIHLIFSKFEFEISSLMNFFSQIT